MSRYVSELCHEATIRDGIGHVQRYIGHVFNMHIVLKVRACDIACIQRIKYIVEDDCDEKEPSQAIDYS